MNFEHDRTTIVHAWLREDDHVSAAAIIDGVLGKVDSLPQRRGRWLPARRPPMSPAVRLTVATAAVVVVLALGINLLSRGGFVGGPPVPAWATPSPRQTTGASLPEPVPFLPPDGTPPTDAHPGELVLQWDGSITESGTLWVYADGRMIWWRLPSEPGVDGEAFIGLFQQRLTPSGVEFLRSRVLSTGLFGSDLVLAQEGDAPYLQIQVQNADRLVSVTWAWRGITKDAPVATSAQASELTALNTLLTDPASWPASSWEDQTERAYVPAQYAICFRSFPPPAEPIEPSRIWALLPGAAENLLLSGDPPPPGVPHPNPGCSRVTTDNAIAIASSMKGAGIQQATPTSGGEYWLRFLLHDQGDLGNLIWINFEPVLPNGGSTWLGPG